MAGSSGIRGKVHSEVDWKKFSSVIVMLTMMKKSMVKRLIVNNWIPKIASLLVAIALWFLISRYQENNAVLAEPVPGSR